MNHGRTVYYQPSREVVDERRRLYEAWNWEPHWIERVTDQWERVLQKTQERAEAWERVQEVSAQHIKRLGIEEFRASRNTVADVADAQAAYELADRRANNAIRHLKRCESPERLDRHQIPRSVREEVLQRWEKDGRICAVSGKVVPAGEKVHLQHKRPVWNGSDSSVSNLSAAHGSCPVEWGNSVG